MSEDTLGCRDLGLRGESATGIHWEDARDAAGHPAMPRAAPSTKNDPALSAEAEKLEGSEAIERSSQNRDSGAFGHTVTYN